MLPLQSEKSKALYDEHARKTVGADLHRQVWRSVNGKPIGQDQVDLIVSAIRAGLDLRADHHLLELACGNGALSQYFIGDCTSYVGVDISDCLIDVAKNKFENAPRIRFTCDDALEFIRNEKNPEIFSRTLCYAALQYFPDELIVDLLDVLRSRFLNVERIFIGNHPDVECARVFFGNDGVEPEMLNNNETPIGIWRSKDRFISLCEASGWSATISRMPKVFYASGYRFDAVLHRRRDR